MALEHESDSALARAVRVAGSQSAFGRLVKKRQSTVREWLLADRLPGEYVLAIELATKIPKEELRPDLYVPVAAAPSMGSGS
ncbi:YdaS antitoxin of YdaST toxin-antitoxin system [Sphingomonas faeni]|jgi:DNA-binding transcriptional regulator YdaS (Cro superfamily)|uniref:YdaS antitoxin of YdaST toxin-antitoxin system n=1 Tax=Sphingomonas faeni TaxID=185950 RepID=A0A2T5U0S1_9SPHN|nr:YdaS family helix-turn-helix protein [Sphingomonas faeni]PTW45098.1 YdaS antitoxin of YdaST toxin-antitoxin system [Sphingomonas faeni]